MDVSVIVPTYAEAENLAVLVPLVSAVLARAGLTGEILIVDDDSPDDTLVLCQRLRLSYPVRLVLRKGQRGLSGAVLHGMRQARGDILLVMDADLSHPPETIPQLVMAIRSGKADFAIGSRYVPGASTDEAWPLFRRLTSRFARLLARPLTSARDPLAGFFALSRATWEQGHSLDPIGFKIGLELMVKCDCRKITEVPIHFHDRRHGTSKLNLREQINYLRHLGRLYRYVLTRRITGRNSQQGAQICG